MSDIPEITPYSPVGGFYYCVLNKSPLGPVCRNISTSRDLGVRKFYTCLILIILGFIITNKAVSQVQENPARTVKIGLLIQDSSWTSAVHSAELAVSNTNSNGGLNGLKFQLVVRSMEGPWGTGSKQAVNLIFEEEVWALLGLHDGRNAHLVEQAATKSQVVFMSAWSGDPTLSQAFVPWFYNCVPNDRQQAASLTEEIYNNRKINNVAVVYTNDYDSKMSLKNFLTSVKTAGKPDPVQFCFDDFEQKSGVLLDKINKEDLKCIVLFCQPSDGAKLVRQIRHEKTDMTLFGSLMLLNENELTAEELQVYDDILSVPFEEWNPSKSSAFIRDYSVRFGRRPGMVAAYAFDGMNLIIEAIKIAGSADREKIQKALSEINYKGVTGAIQFDIKGNRSGKVEITKLRKGTPTNIGIF